MKYETLQEGIFLWVFKLHQDYNTVMQMPFYKAKKFIELFTKYEEEFGKSLKEAASKIKSGSKMRK